MEMDTTNPVRSNFWKLNGISIARNSMILMPVIVLFFQDLGLTLREVFILQSVFAGAVVLLEVPTGYLGDILRRKDGLIIGSICTTLGYFGFYFAGGFWGLMIAEIFLALGYTFFSGSDAALVYDSLLELGEEDSFKKIKGKYSSFGNFSEAIGAIVGGFLVVRGYDRVTFIQATISVLGIILAFTLVEPQREKYEVHEAGFGQLVSLVKNALFTHGTISALVMYSAFTGVTTMFWVWLAQPYWEYVGIPLVVFGLLRAVGNASVGVFSWFADRIITKVGTTTLLTVTPLLAVLTYIIFGLTSLPVLVVCMFSFYACRGILGIAYQDMLNKLVSSKERATILSVKSLAFRAMFMIFGPLVGYTADMYGIQSGMIFAGIVSLVFIVIGYALLKKNNILTNKSQIA